MSSIKRFLTSLEGIIGTNASKDTNRYIKTRIKIVKHELDICFIKKCLNNETLPPFSRIKIATTNNKRFINDIRAQITHRELNNKTKNKRRLEKSLKNLQNRLFELDPDQWLELTKLIDEKIKTIVDIKNQIHRKKLEKLGIKIYSKINSKFVNKRRNNIEQIEQVSNKQTIFNFSSKVLNEIETRYSKKV